MAWARSAIGAKRSSRSSAAASFSHFSAFFSGLTAAAPFAAAAHRVARRSPRTRAASSGPRGRCSSAAAPSRRAATAESSGPRGSRSLLQGPRSRRSQEPAAPGVQRLRGRGRVEADLAPLARAARRRARRSRARAAAPASRPTARRWLRRAASRSAFTSLGLAGVPRRRRARPARPQTGHGPSPYASWKCSARSRMSARSFDRAARVPAASLISRVAPRAAPGAIGPTLPGAGRLASCLRSGTPPSSSPPVGATTASSASRSFASSATTAARARSSSSARMRSRKRLALQGRVLLVPLARLARLRQRRLRGGQLAQAQDGGERVEQLRRALVEHRAQLAVREERAVGLERLAPTQLRQVHARLAVDLREGLAARPDRPRPSSASRRRSRPSRPRRGTRPRPPRSRGAGCASPRATPSSGPASGACRR